MLLVWHLVHHRCSWNCPTCTDLVLTSSFSLCVVVSFSNWPWTFDTGDLLCELRLLFVTLFHPFVEFSHDLVLSITETVLLLLIWMSRRSCCGVLKLRRDSKSNGASLHGIAFFVVVFVVAFFTGTV